MIDVNAWARRRGCTYGVCTECGAMGVVPLPPDGDCTHLVSLELTGSRAERLAQALRITYGSPDGTRRPIHERRNDWLADAEELLRVVGLP